MDQEQTQNINQKQRKTFTDYYWTNPEFRKKHREYMAQKVYCPCGIYMARGAMTYHKRSNKHMLWLETQRKLWKEIQNKSKYQSQENQEWLEKNMKIFQENINLLSEFERKLIFYESTFH